MRFSILSLITLLNALTVVSFLIPHDVRSLSIRDNSRLNDLFKRKGGGGGGKGGSSSSSSGSSGSSSTSSGSSSGGSSSSAGRTSTGSNLGGSSVGGSGSPRSYGGGRYYGGGATVPYTAGATSQRGLGARALLPVAALGLFGGAWLYGAYLYSYPRPYGFYNASAGQNQTKPVDCLCQQYSVCGCDDNDDNTFLNGLIGNGSYDSLNSSLVRVADVNGTSTIVINGTLENGTTASGGTSAAIHGSQGNMGWLAIAATLSAALMML